MPTNTLTDAKCRAIKPAEKPAKHFDGHGLHLLVTPAGGKIWRLAYRFGGKPKTMSFGPYPEVSLADARGKRDEARAVLREGTDPMAERKAPPKPTLSEAWHAYWDGRQDLTDGYKQDGTRCMETYIWPTLKDRPIDQVTKAELLDALNGLNAKGRFDYVRKARMWLCQVFDWAIGQDHCEINLPRLITPKSAFGKRKRRNFPAIDPHEVGAFMDRLGMENQQLQAVLACRFLAYTWLRTTECRMMIPEEVIGGETVLLKEGRMKRSRDHIVPLPRQAQEILKQMLERSRGGRFIWPGERTIERPMSENAVLALIYRIGYRDRMCGHGWRSVGSTWANERGYNPDAVEMQLSHFEADSTRGAYNRAQYLEERRKMLQDWADWLDAQVGASA